MQLLIELFEFQYQSHIAVALQNVNDIVRCKPKLLFQVVSILFFKIFVKEYDFSYALLVYLLYQRSLYHCYHPVSFIDTEYLKISQKRLSQVWCLDLIVVVEPQSKKGQCTTHTLKSAKPF